MLNSGAQDSSASVSSTAGSRSAALHMCTEILTHAQHGQHTHDAVTFSCVNGMSLLIGHSFPFLGIRLSCCVSRVSRGQGGHQRPRLVPMTTWKMARGEMLSEAWSMRSWDERWCLQCARGYWSPLLRKSRSRRLCASSRSVSTCARSTAFSFSSKLARTAISS